MKSFSKAPLYLGVAIFVFSVLLSAIKLGEKNSVTNLQSRADFSGAVLSMQYTSPDLISVFVNSENKIIGADITIKYETDKIQILPTSLQSGPSFVTAGGEVNKEESTYSFSALSRDEAVRSGVVGTFRIKPINQNPQKQTITLSFILDGDSTVVLDKDTGEDILDTKSLESAGVYRYTIEPPNNNQIESGGVDRY